MNELCSKCPILETCRIHEPVAFNGYPIRVLWSDCVHYTCVDTRKNSTWVFQRPGSLNRKMLAFIPDGKIIGVTIGSEHKPTFRPNGKYVRIVTENGDIYTKDEFGLFQPTGQNIKDPLNEKG